VLVAALALCGPLSAGALADSIRWLPTWAPAQQVPEPHNALPAEELRDATLRQVLRITRGGDRLRVRLSNAFGTAPLTISAAHLALAAEPGTSRIVEGTGRPLTFDGQAGVIIPAGAEYLSDPVDLTVPALASLAVTLHLPDAPERQTGHPGSRTTSYLVSGNRVAAPELTDAKRVDRWYQLSGVEVAAETGTAIVVLGDSITDGYGTTTNGNDRWPDLLAERLQADPALRGFSVLNKGIGGNRLLADGLGPNALARLDRDVLALPGVSHLILLEGVNDLGSLARAERKTAEDHARLVHRIIGAYRQIVIRARARGITVIGATILPFTGSDHYRPDAAIEADRQAVNAWIRTPGNVDAVLDLDAVMRDPSDPARLRPDYDSGDHLHPSLAGYRAMAEAVPPGLFSR